MAQIIWYSNGRSLHGNYVSSNNWVENFDNIANADYTMVTTNVNRTFSGPWYFSVNYFGLQGYEDFDGVSVGDVATISTDVTCFSSDPWVISNNYVRIYSLDNMDYAIGDYSEIVANDDTWGGNWICR